MALLVPDVGEARFLNLILNKATPENLTLKLFTSNSTPTEADTAASYTFITPGTAGYADAPITAAEWTVTGGAPSDATAAQKTFNFNAALPAPGQVYGYAVISPTGTILMWAERFTDGPYTIANAGDQIKITPKITCD